jgi:hypothetical protein
MVGTRISFPYPPFGATGLNSNRRTGTWEPAEFSRSHGPLDPLPIAVPQEHGVQRPGTVELQNRRIDHRVNDRSNAAALIAQQAVRCRTDRRPGGSLVKPDRPRVRRWTFSPGCSNSRGPDSRAFGVHRRGSTSLNEGRHWATADQRHSSCAHEPVRLIVSSNKTVSARPDLR